MTDGPLSPDAFLRQHGEELPEVPRLRVIRPERGRMAGRLRILSVADARTAPVRDYLLDGLLGVGEASVWWGTPKKAAKTFLLLRLAYGLALGRGMWDREACKCAVLYVAAEGQGGIHGRIAALADAFGDAAWFRYVAQGVDLLNPDAGADTGTLVEAGNALLDEIQGETGTRPRLLIVVDTYHRTAPGAEENSARDAGLYLANVDRLREGTGAHVAVIHHGADRPRGSTAIDGAADLLMHVQKAEDGTHRATVAGAKDDESGAVLAFQLRVVDLPPDARGRARTTCVAEETDSAAVGTSASRREGLSVEDRGWMGDIEALFALPNVAQEGIRPVPGMPPVRAVTRNELRSWLQRRGRIGGVDFVTPRDSPVTLSANDRQTLRRKLNRLKDLGKIGLTEHWVWLF